MFCDTYCKYGIVHFQAMAVQGCMLLGELCTLCWCGHWKSKLDIYLCSLYHMLNSVILGKKKTCIF